MRGTNQIPFLKAALVGFILGVAASSTYVALGGDTWLSIPTWALILLYPGFMVVAGMSIQAPQREHDSTSF